MTRQHSQAITDRKPATVAITGLRRASPAGITTETGVFHDLMSASVIDLEMNRPVEVAVYKHVDDGVVFKNGVFKSRNEPTKNPITEEQVPRREGVRGGRGGVG